MLIGFEGYNAISIIRQELIVVAGHLLSPSTIKEKAPKVRLLYARACGDPATQENPRKERYFKIHIKP